ncbi:hypothetical protein TRVA0_002S01376 [Trichomonascus vanleenenianus]|uniref:alpha-hydroxy acid oxidase n=1 Tax=Trichomonascus vanleenenianus TaxID=2268995 RepID=UPI003ECA8186
MILTNLKDLEEVALPLAAKDLRDFWQSGANDLVTLRENESNFNNYRIRARAMKDVSAIDMRPKKLFGRQFDMPIGIAPCSHHQCATPEGEAATVKACETNKWPMALSSFSNRSAEEVIAAGPNSAVFFQLYVFKNRKTSVDLIRRVEKAGYKAILLTVDTPYVGQRYSDMKNKFVLPKHVSLGNFPGSTVPNPVERGRKDEEDSGNNANVIDPSLNWGETIPWLRANTKLEIWVKGIVTAEDTEAAIAAGVDGIWVSNHGGRQLDYGLSTIEALPEVVAAARGRVPIHMDGGIRRGADVFRALALGADFVWLARPALYGLLYDGQKGVELMQRLLQEELKHVMAFAGTPKISDIGVSSLIRVWPRPERVYKL